jgi:hypothetical protein
VGLAIDEDNQPELTESLIKSWVAQIKTELALLAHCNSEGLYWYCLSCRQTMPVLKNKSDVSYYHH